MLWPNIRSSLFACVAFLILFANAAHGAEKWTWYDTTLQATFFLFQAEDLSQTLHIARNPDQFHEMNSIMGAHPSTTKVKVYFAIGAVSHLAIAYVLPHPWRTLWQGVWIGVEAVSVQHNRKAEPSVGIHLHF
jgi:hypothetical protein